jgi:hypothetical protein
LSEVEDLLGFVGLSQIFQRVEWVNQRDEFRQVGCAAFQLPQSGFDLFEKRVGYIEEF